MHIPVMIKEIGPSDMTNIYLSPANLTTSRRTKVDGGDVDFRVIVVGQLYIRMCDVDFRVIVVGQLYIRMYDLGGPWRSILVHVDDGCWEWMVQHRPYIGCEDVR